MLWTVQKFTDNLIGCKRESIGVIDNINYDCIQSSNMHVGLAGEKPPFTSPRTCSQTEEALQQVVTVPCRKNEAVTSDGEDCKKSTVEATANQQSTQGKEDPCPNQHPCSAMLDHLCQTHVPKGIGMIGSSYISLSQSCLICYIMHTCEHELRTWKRS